jgi:NTE family protein
MRRKLNFVLAGGGVKGISYIGVFEVAEQRKVGIGNITGVSAGALAGAYAAAGFTSGEMKEILYGFDFDKIDINQISKKVPIVARYLQYKNSSRESEQTSIESFIDSKVFNNNSRNFYNELCSQEDRGSFFKNLITLCKEGCLYNGDYLEQWTADVLLKKGIRTFGDLRGGISDEMNPNGYKIRMTAVDTNRGKIIILPDDIEFYNINPDKLEVSKAIRMSTSVPFAFKPVELKSYVGGKMKTFHIVDGGVLDNMPTWLADKNSSVPTIGFKFRDNNKTLHTDTPLSILNFFISAVHDTGVPKKMQKLKYVTEIDTSKVSSLDFNLKYEEKEYLYTAGKNAANTFFNNYKYRNKIRFGLYNILYRMFRKT